MTDNSFGVFIVNTSWRMGMRQLRGTQYLRR
jgi:hypothetical protein